MTLRFEEPPVDAFDSTQRKPANGVDRKMISHDLKAAPGTWAKIYGEGTEVPAGALRSTISQWRAEGFEVKLTDMPNQDTKDIENRNKRFNAWIRWPEGQPEPDGSPVLAAPAAPRPPVPPAPPLAPSRPTAPDAEPAPGPVTPTPTDGNSTPRTAFQMTWEDRSPEGQPEPLV